MSANTGHAANSRKEGSGRGVQPLRRRAQRPPAPGRLERRGPLRRLVVSRLQSVEDGGLQVLGLPRVVGVHAGQR